MKTLFEVFEAPRSRRQADCPRTAVEPGLQPSRRHDPSEWGPHRHTARGGRGGTAARTDPPARPAGGAGVPDPARVPFGTGRRALRADKLAEPRHRRRLHRGHASHTFSGVVRVETIYNDFDFRTKRFAGEFLWHDSVEAAEFRRQRHATEPVCWTQLGYASGYASEFFDALVVYKEVECLAAGDSHCKVVGKLADVWGPGDPEVILFRERIATSQEGILAEPLRKIAERTAERRSPISTACCWRPSVGTRQAGADGAPRYADWLARHRPEPGGALPPTRLGRIRNKATPRCRASRRPRICAENAGRGKNGRRGAAGRQS